MEVSEGATQSSSVPEKTEEPMEESNARSDDVVDQAQADDVRESEPTSSVD